MTNPSQAAPDAHDGPVSPGLVALAWLWVTVPLIYAIWQLITKITQLFNT
jgi:hypothetical protein